MVPSVREPVDRLDREVAFAEKARNGVEPGVFRRK
jgi:hypothetical protein